MKVTRHAKERIRERKGTKGDVFRVAERAFKYGIQHKDTSGRLNKYITSLFFRYGCQSNNIRIYGNNVYIFNGETLVTVLPLPKDFEKVCAKIRRRNQETSCDNDEIEASQG